MLALRVADDGGRSQKEKLQVAGTSFDEQMKAQGDQMTRSIAIVSVVMFGGILAILVPMVASQP